MDVRSAPPRGLVARRRRGIGPRHAGRAAALAASLTALAALVQGGCAAEPMTGGGAAASSAGRAGDASAMGVAGDAPKGARSTGLSPLPPRVDFGEVGPAEQVERSLRFIAVGHGVATVTGMQLHGASNFELIAPVAFPLVVHRGGALRAQVRFRGDVPQARHATLDVATARGTVSAHLVGNAGAPCLRVAPVEVGFGAVSVGSSAARAVRVDNCGSSSVELSHVRVLAGSHPAFSVTPSAVQRARPGAPSDREGGAEPWALQVQPGESLHLVAVFAPTEVSALHDRAWVPETGVAWIEVPVWGPIAGFSLRGVARP